MIFFLHEECFNVMSGLDNTDSFNIVCAFAHRAMGARSPKISPLFFTVFQQLSFHFEFCGVCMREYNLVSMENVNV